MNKPPQPTKPPIPTQDLQSTSSTNKRGSPTDRVQLEMR
jgi:hypothetical protein